MSDVIGKDTIFMLSTGSWSDYGVSCILRALKDTPTSEVLRLFQEKYPVKMVTEDGYNYDENLSKRHPSTLAAFMVENGYVEEIAAEEWHLRDYSSDPLKPFEG